MATTNDIFSSTIIHENNYMYKIVICTPQHSTIVIHSPVFKIIGNTLLEVFDKKYKEIKIFPVSKVEIAKYKVSEEEYHTQLKECYTEDNE